MDGHNAALLNRRAPSQLATLVPHLYKHLKQGKYTSQIKSESARSHAKKIKIGKLTSMYFNITCPCYIPQFSTYLTFIAHVNSRSRFSHLRSLQPSLATGHTVDSTDLDVETLSSFRVRLLGSSFIRSGSKIADST